MNISGDLTSIVGLITLIAAASGTFALWLFRVFGENWLKTYFENQRTKFENIQQREIERLRFEISKLMDRATKLHEREFDVVPEAWGRLVVVRKSVTSLTAPLQYYPDLQAMNDAQFDEFLQAAHWQAGRKPKLGNPMTEPDIM